MHQKKVIIIGGGAAGFFAAINIAEMAPHFDVTIIEKSSKFLSKVKVSGGGRCNVTNACTEINALSKNYPRGEKELKKAFYSFGTKNTKDWFEKRGIKLKTEADGRMFPETNDSQTIIDCLLNLCSKYGIKINSNTVIRSFEKKENAFFLETGAETILKCDALVIASGGSQKKENYNWIIESGHSIEPPVPSLFTFNISAQPEGGIKHITHFSGVTIPLAVVKIAGTKLSSRGPLLITHWGFSGPAVLKLSAFGARILHQKNYNFTVLINWTSCSNDQEVKDELELTKKLHPQKKVLNTPLFELPKRLWEYLCEKSLIKEEQKWDSISSKSFNKLWNHLFCDEYQAKGKTTFKEEFVTCGGVKLSEVDFDSMESKIVPGLYFCGEVLDMDGITGGFNFQAAWTSGWIAARAIATNKKNLG